MAGISPCEQPIKNATPTVLAPGPRHGEQSKQFRSDEVLHKLKNLELA
jgi:hypothetical protein